jgi:hypothetical protein
MLPGVTAANCSGANLVYTAKFGCFNVNPPAGAATIERNYGRGPGSATLMLRLSRTWAFGEKRATDPNAGGFGGPPPGGGGGWAWRSGRTWRRRSTAGRRTSRNGLQ